MEIHLPSEELGQGLSVKAEAASLSEVGLKHPWFMAACKGLASTWSHSEH